MKPLSTNEKAAVVLMSLGTELAAEIVKHLAPDQARRILTAAEKLQHVDSVVADEVLMEFAALAGERPTPDYQQLSRSILARAGLEAGHGLSETLSAVDPDVLGRTMINEHPQTMAVICAHLEPAACAEVFKTLPSTLQTQVMLRIAKLEQVEQTVLDEIDDWVRHQVLKPSHLKVVPGGVQKVAAILNAMGDQGEQIITTLHETAPADIVDKIENERTTLTDIAALEVNSMIKLIAQITPNDLLLALKVAPSAVKEKIYGAMSERARARVQSDFDALGRVPKTKVDEAVQRILAKFKSGLNNDDLILEGDDRFV